MRKLSPHPVAPAFADAPHAVCSHGGLVGWALDAPGALVQCVEPVKATAQMATWLVTTGFETLQLYFPQVRDLTLVLDFHMMVGRTAAARSILMNSAKVLGDRFSEVYVVPPAAYPAIYLQAFHASVALARLLGMRVTLVSSSAQLVERYGWRPLASRELAAAIG